MRLFCTIAVLLAVTCLPTSISQRQALFVKKDIIENGKRVARQTSADQMVQNILQWLQGVYTQNSRRVRQGTLREYLPPINTQKPRPFQPVTQGNHVDGSGTIIINGGYPAAGSITPRPPFDDGGIYPSILPSISPPVQYPGFTGYPTSSRPQPPFPPSTFGYPGSTSTGPSGPTGFPTTGFPSTTFPRPTNGYSSGPSTAYPAAGTGFPTSSIGYPTTNFPSLTPGYLSPSTGYPGPSTSYPTTTTTDTIPNFPSRVGIPSEDLTTTTTTTTPSPTNGYPTPSIGYSCCDTETPDSDNTTPDTDIPISNTGLPTTSSPTTTSRPSTTLGSLITDFPTSSPQPFSTFSPSTSQTSTSGPTDSPSEEPSTTHSETQTPFTSFVQTTLEPITTEAAEENTIPSEEATSADRKSDAAEATTVAIPSRFSDDDDDKHPPHIHAIDVECSKEMMTINMEFNREFNGIVYSKGHYSNPDCKYVKENSGQTKYSFTVNLDTCGTEFINAFDTQGKSYLENVLVLQNEPGIQEVWDTIRSVRCLWEGNLKKALNVALSVGMLNQEIVTFSGDTAMARLDIQLGKGPFAPAANGLVKIGEVMTLVVSVSGDAGFDIQVKDCRAKDSNGDNVVALTDDRGCILKPKLFGAFQKTRNTGDSGASIIAYAFFNAFKFPDVMDLVMECNVDLCKTDCEMCPDPDQKTEPGRRRRRDIYSQNYTDDTNDNSVTMGKMLKVILPEDISDSHTTINFTQNEGICMSAQGFVLSAAVLISLLTSSCLFSAYMWLKYQRLNLKK